MLIFVGTLVTLLSVFGGYALAGGHLGALIQPVEVLMIVGAGVGHSSSVMACARSRQRCA